VAVVSIDDTTAVWQARIDPETKLFLLAVAECSGSDGEVASFMFRSLDKVAQMTCLSEREVQDMALRVFGHGQSLGPNNGTNFKFTDVVRALEARLEEWS
jgi:hypothetical protein